MTSFTTSFSRGLLALASLTVLGACSKKDDGPGVDAGPYSFDWTVDGKNYSCTSARQGIDNGQLALTANVQVDSSLYLMAIHVPAAVGTYTFPSPNQYWANYSVYKFGGPSRLGVQIDYEALAMTGIGAGTVTVSVLSSANVGGTFSFTGVTRSSSLTASKTITNGRFNIKR